MTADSVRPQKQLIINVDDDASGRYARRRTLEHAGFEVLDAGFGQEALDKVEAHRPVLVVLDVHLPDISGLDVCKAIKKRMGQVMVLQTSATFITAADRSRGLEGGADAYLVEPIDPTELVATVNALLRLHAAEDQLRELNQDLERRVQERTERLRKANLDLIGQIAKRERAEEVLAQARHMESVGQAATASATDLQQVFSSIAEAARRATDFPESARAGLETVLEQSQRGMSLCTRLLQYSDAVEVDLHPVDITDVIEGMRPWLRRLSGPAVVLAVSTRPMLAVTDANHLELALFDLVRRASTGIDQLGRVLVSVERRDATHGLPPGSYIVISVAGRRGDKGPTQGVPESSDSLEAWARTRAHQGLAQGQVAGGTIRMSDGPDEGIELWLPMADEAALDVRMRSLEPADRNLSKNGCVLVVDDDRGQRAAVRHALQAAGHVVVVAGSGVEALALARRLPTALLVVDFAMPGMSGIELVNHIRHDNPRLPVVFMSAQGNALDIQASLQAAMIVAKPVDVGELMAAVRSMLETSGS